MRIYKGQELNWYRIELVYRVCGRMVYRVESTSITKARSIAQDLFGRYNIKNIEEDLK